MQNEHACAEGVSGSRRPLLDYAVLAIIVACFLIDPVPRFFQGDSIAYVTTDYGLRGWLPPDRSWVFGALSNFFLRRTHGYQAFVFVQAALLLAALLFFKHALARESRWRGAVSAGCLLVALDPLSEIYTRFVMSDLIAAAGFVVGLGAAVAISTVRAKRHFIYAAVGALAIFPAVLMRSSYGLMIGAALAGALVLLWPRLSRRQVGALACVLLSAPVAMGWQVAANRIVFSRSYPHETFLLKNSGVFLAGVFSPAFTAEDFVRAGAPVSREEFDRLELKNMSLRNAQIWADSPRFIHRLVKDKLQETSNYSAKVDRASKAIFFNALTRAPLSIAQVYLYNLGQYLNPREWKGSAVTEMGLDHDLPKDFLDYSNTFSARKLSANITRLRSVLIRGYLALSGLYPLQLLAGAGAALYLLVCERRSPACVFLAAGALTTLALAPLYSVYVIPRYLLVTVMINYTLIPMMVVSIHQRLKRRREMRL